MIKEDKIEICVVARSINKYKSLGYVCNIGDIIFVDIKDIPQQSHSRITAICDCCKTEKVISLYAYWKNYNKQNKYTCNKCKQSKIENTNLQRYGTKRPIQNKEVRKKLENTNLERYGTNIATKNVNVKNKIINTNLERYGVTSTAKLDIIKKKQKETNFNKYKNKYNNINITIVDDENNYSISCDKGHNYIINSINIYNRIKYNTELCVICNPIGNKYSGMENELFNFIQENYDGNIIRNSRIENKELDIYLPEINLAFEFNGLYWHSEIYKDKNYHKDKTELCNKNNIRLYHIWEDDWLYKKDIVKSMILNKLGKSKNKIFARKCVIKVIDDNKKIKDFLDNNHIQGFVGSSVKIGLYYKNELVSLMTFKKNKNNYELNRFCNLLEHSVVGSFSKLLVHFQKMYEYDYITSLADLSYSYGDIYEKYFVLDDILKPDYKYIVDGIRKHKFNFRYKNEKNVMLDKKIYKIYNCGLKKYTLKCSNM